MERNTHLHAEADVRRAAEHEAAELAEEERDAVQRVVERDAGGVVRGAERRVDGARGLLQAVLAGPVGEEDRELGGVAAPGEERLETETTVKPNFQSMLLPMAAGRRLQSTISLVIRRIIASRIVLSRSGRCTHIRDGYRPDCHTCRSHRSGSFILFHRSSGSLLLLFGNSANSLTKVLRALVSDLTRVA